MLEFNQSSYYGNFYYKHHGSREETIYTTANRHLAPLPVKSKSIIYTVEKAIVQLRLSKGIKQSDYLALKRLYVCPSPILSR